ncbi:hypothetical protein GHT06_021230 [Daphnia sinensis]|uniref:Uncharacterized protein n=1 Tax=Daphnia sinensis TaxID=1820382 RepID=A0AAD5KIS0_9CRUS|nr:hypothetical protein GHT06_021230 [Daphnia sinensis]
MPGNFRTDLDPYQSDIPEVCFSQVTAALKARLKLDENKGLACMVVTATSQGNILIFFQKKLLKCCQLPFRDCSEILLYHSFQFSVTKEFLIAISFTKGCVIIDLQTLSVIKSWPDAKRVEIKDEKLLGYPQVILHLNHNEFQQEKVVVTYESDWEVKAKDDPALLEGESALNSVAQALEAQAKKANENLLLLEKQISFRKSLAIRALTALNDIITAKTNNLQPPSYTTKLEKGDSIRPAPEVVQVKDVINPVETTGMWQFLDCTTDSWVIGSAFTNISGKALSDITCCFLLLNENMNYRVHYYLTAGKISKNVPSPSTGFSMQEVLETSKSFSGTLDNNTCLIVIVTTSIPRFVDTEEEIGSLLLTCKLCSSPAQIFQSSLGNVRLHFSDLGSNNMSFSPTTIDLMSLRRNIFGMLSLLTAEGDAVVSTIVSPAFRSFRKVTQQLSMDYWASMQCFYSLGEVYGHVCILVLENNANSVKIKIRAQSERRLQWFTRHFKSALSDDCSFSQVTVGDQVAEQKFPAMNNLNFAVAMLSNAEIASEDNVGPLEETAPPFDVAFEEIRKEFLKKQGKFLGMSKQRSGNIKISTEHYRQLQRCWFD